MPHFEKLGIQVYALSYDEADALRDFRDAHSITYTLLSDPHSEVIRSFGILNTLIDEDDHPWFGIPYPGTYIVDAKGEITHKFFDSNLAVRAGPEQLIRAALGETVEPVAGTPLSVESVQVDLALEGETLMPTVQRDLVARFRVPAGRHVYAWPAPTGSVAVDIRLDQDERLVQRPVTRPASEPHSLPGSEETFLVHHNEFELRLPLTVNSALSREDTSITIAGTIHWQSCDDEVCDIPSSERFELTAAIGQAPANALWNKTGEALEPNAAAHFKKMTSRRER